MSSKRMGQALSSDDSNIEEVEDDEQQKSVTRADSMQKGLISRKEVSKAALSDTESVAMQSGQILHCNRRCIRIDNRACTFQDKVMEGVCNLRTVLMGIWGRSAVSPSCCPQKTGTE